MGKLFEWFQYSNLKVNASKCCFLSHHINQLQEKPRILLSVKILRVKNVLPGLQIGKHSFPLYCLTEKFNVFCFKCLILPWNFSNLCYSYSLKLRPKPPQDYPIFTITVYLETGTLHSNFSYTQLTFVFHIQKYS